MKKLLAILLAVSMIFAMSVPVFADDSTDAATPEES